jgi:HEAT repeat protein
MVRATRFVGVAVVIALSLTRASAASAAAPESKRLGHAKDLIADEQWARAIAELRAAVSDPAEKSKDEALYWLAHSLNQAGDWATAIQTIRQLEERYPRSLWVKPAGSLRIDIASHMRRDDVLWYAAAPPSGAPTWHEPAMPAQPGATTVAPAPAPAPSASRPARAPRAAAPTQPPATAWVFPAEFPTQAWLPDDYRPDTDQRIQALGSLLRTDAPRVIPMLKEITLETEDTNEARRALWVMAQSGAPEAREAVLQVARDAKEPVQIAAVRELFRFPSPEVTHELLQIYSAAKPLVKTQIVVTLAARSDRVALLRIIESEKDKPVRDAAIVRLGQAGGAPQLRALYMRVGPDSKPPIIDGLFRARAESELIQIADVERDLHLRSELLQRLQMLGTPAALAYVRQASQNR